MEAQEGHKMGSTNKEMTFRKDKEASELRIEKLNSHPSAQDFDKHPCVPVSFFGHC